MRGRENRRTFSPRKSTSPDDGSTSRKMHRPVVLFPLPDSPTRPNISPSPIAKLTSSTALTTERARQIPRLRTKCLTRWRTSSRDGVSPQQQSGGESGGEGQSGGDSRQNQASQSQEPRDAMDQKQDSDDAGDDAGGDTARAAAARQTAQSRRDSPLTTEEQQAMAQWLRRIPDDPGGLLRRKFQLEYSKRRRERPAGTDAW